MNEVSKDILELKLREVSFMVNCSDAVGVLEDS